MVSKMQKCSVKCTHNIYPDNKMALWITNKLTNNNDNINENNNERKSQTKEIRIINITTSKYGGGIFWKSFDQPLKLISALKLQTKKLTFGTKTGY